MSEWTAIPISDIDGRFEIRPPIDGSVVYVEHRQLRPIEDHDEHHLEPEIPPVPHLLKHASPRWVVELNAGVNVRLAVREGIRAVVQKEARAVVPASVFPGLSASAGPHARAYVCLGDLSLRFFGVSGLKSAKKKPRGEFCLPLVDPRHAGESRSDGLQRVDDEGRVLLLVSILPGAKAKSKNVLKTAIRQYVEVLPERWVIVLQHKLGQDEPWALVKEVDAFHAAPQRFVFDRDDLGYCEYPVRVGQCGHPECEIEAVRSLVGSQMAHSEPSD